ncbi:uncharacterized protein LOC106668505 isoform X1 [Cimex lectularius]|uniref:Protein sleepless n=1 Tax=Cimex lectularius TaxID=79782 RepID=A0A8I6TIS8_CIMLE|nr:uncharacterized protein LOC106668505 isoform X1 [Cimex lectularius]
MGPQVFSAFLLFLGYLAPVHSILCYQCNSTDTINPYQCTEFLEDDIDIEPKPCDEVFGAAYCIKHTGRFEGGFGTRRYCSSVDLGNYCDTISQIGDQRKYRSCKYTCSTDGCNSSVKTTGNIALTAVLSAIIWFQLH